MHQEMQVAKKRAKIETIECQHICLKSQSNVDFVWHSKDLVQHLSFFLEMYEIYSSLANVNRKCSKWFDLNIVVSCDNSVGAEQRRHSKCESDICHLKFANPFVTRLLKNHFGGTLHDLIRGEIMDGVAVELFQTMDECSRILKFLITGLRPSRFEAPNVYATYWFAIGHKKGALRLIRNANNVVMATEARLKLSM